MLLPNKQNKWTTFVFIFTVIMFITVLKRRREPELKLVFLWKVKLSPVFAAIHHQHLLTDRPMLHNTNNTWVVSLNCKIGNIYQHFAQYLVPLPSEPRQTIVTQKPIIVTVAL